MTDKFQGRINRKSFILSFLLIILVRIILTELFVLDEIIYIPIEIILFILTLSMFARRLHDVDRSGWWSLAYIFPPFALIMIVYFAIVEGQKKENKFGEVPRSLSIF